MACLLLSGKFVRIKYILHLVLPLNFYWFSPFRQFCYHIDHFNHASAILLSLLQKLVFIYGAL
jgi:hypothetical protein